VKTTPEHPPFPIPGVPMTCPDEENGVCWCGGPNQQFPCEPCRLKRDNNNLDLQAVAEPKLRVPHSGARCRSARQGGIARTCISRFSAPCTLYPAPCSLDPVVDLVNTVKNLISGQIKTVTPKKVTVSPKSGAFSHASAGQFGVRLLWLSNPCRTRKATENAYRES
jgi:hypothetical protein